MVIRLQTIDDLGRIVISKEIVKILKVKEGDPIAVFFKDDTIMIKKHFPLCSKGRMI